MEVVKAEEASRIAEEKWKRSHWECVAPFSKRTIGERRAASGELAQPGTQAERSDESESASIKLKVRGCRPLLDVYGKSVGREMS